MWGARMVVSLGCVSGGTRLVEWFVVVGSGASSEVGSVVSSADGSSWVQLELALLCRFSGADGSPSPAADPLVKLSEASRGMVGRSGWCAC